MYGYCEDCDETSPTAFDGRCVHNWAEAARTIRDPNDGEITMKVMMSKCVDAAVKLAIIDCCGSDQMDDLREQYPADSWEQTIEKLDVIKQSWLNDIYTVPDKYWARIDPGALAGNVSCRLLGYGGWTVGDVYGGNATIQEAVDATFARPDQDHIAEMAFDLGLTPTEDGMFKMPEESDDEQD